MSMLKHTTDSEKIDFLLAASSLAHEIKTPLASISLLAQNLRHTFIRLSMNNKNEYNNLVDTKNLCAKMLTLSEEFLQNIRTEVSSAIFMTNMLMDNAQTTTTNSPAILKLCSIQQCIHSAIKRYPFRKNEADYIHFTQQDDFMFQGLETPIVHVLFNLLKNALYFIRQAGRGNITFYISKELDHNCLHFKDTAKGIEPDVLPHIFESFYTTRPNGIGIGLAFCRHIMTSLGGKIECHSKLGEFTEFILKFSRVHKN